MSGTSNDDEKSLILLEEGRSDNEPDTVYGHCPVCGEYSDWRNNQVVHFRSFFLFAFCFAMGVFVGSTVPK
jgi:hypothetical protein